LDGSGHTVRTDRQLETEILVMVKLYNAETSVPVGEITEGQLQFMIDNLEETSSDDQITGSTFRLSPCSDREERTRS